MYDHKDLPSDYVARNLALDVTQSLHVEAPAGSGKTTLLVARYIKLLARVRHPHEILALTFTNKAAGEMKTRIGELLHKAYFGLEPSGSLEAALLDDAKEALRRHESRRPLLLSPDGLQVMTFHAFCYALIKRAPLEAGVSPGSVVLQEEEQNVLLDESIKELVRDLLSVGGREAERRAFENRLLRLNNNLPALLDEIKDLLKKRDLFSDLVETLRFHPNLEDFEAALTRRLGKVVEDFIKEALDALTVSSIGRQWPEFWRHLREKRAPNAELLPQDLPGPVWSCLPAWKAIADALTTKNGNPRKQMGPLRGGFYNGFSNGPWGSLVKGLSPELTHLLWGLKELPEPDESLIDIDALTDLIILVAGAIGSYEDKCRRQHVLDFVGLEQAALRILGDDNTSDLQLILDHRIHHILVDEFQDTSRSQWVLLQRLCAGWSPGDGRTVFMVGDPKQSVYAFRKAEVRLFLEARKGIPIVGQGLLPVTNVQLEANFRSQAALVSWTNQLFERTVMAEPNASLDEVVFQPSTPYPDLRDFRRTPCVSLNIFSETDPDLSQSEAEAQWLAETVRHAVSERYPGHSVGILLFTRNRLAVYLNALRRSGVAVRVKEGLKIAQRPEVMHLHQMAIALCRPHDDLAWGSLVRSPWTWVDAGLLFKIAGMAPVAWSEKLKLAAERYPGIRALEKALDMARKRVGRAPLANVVRDVWMALDGPAAVAARFGPEGVANCRLFLDVIDSVDAAIPEETLSRLDLALVNLYAPESPEAAGAPVDLMTVHAAKGLEFDLVFLPFLDWRPLGMGYNPPYLLERSSELSGLPIIAMGPDRRTDETGADYRLLKRLAAGRKMGEVKRLLYVGITRARKELFLSGVAQSAKHGPMAPNDSPLAWIMTHARDHETRLMHKFFDPSPPEHIREHGKLTKPLPQPLSFKGQPLPYLVETPSELVHSATQLADRSTSKPADLRPPIYSQTTREGGADPSLQAVIRGTVTHRLLQSFWNQGAIPEAKSIATALAAEGLNHETAGTLSLEIAEELRACLGEPFFEWLFDRTNSSGKSEFAIEAVTKQGAIQTGVIDFVKQDGGHWWIVDFKTATPEYGQLKTDFVKAQVEHYRPQLTAYQEVLAKANDVDPKRIRVGLYFTGLQEWHEIRQ